ncbi:DUF1285 domain-containing protein [Granulosicoccaceae sp. 1_MG-2023]|nr:DUF1285 domain-containing protein [Granulosicoccaceae sp. 1_MG-2023]
MASTVSLQALEAALAGQKRPPVHLWHPDKVGSIDIRIDREGRWFHEGGEIRREALVRLFSSILRREGDRHYLVTPAEKLAIDVAVAPFLAISVKRAKDEQGRDVFVFMTNIGDEIAAGPEHRLQVQENPGNGEPLPLLHVRDGLQALLSRPVFYELAGYGDIDGNTLTLQSAGERFVLGVIE